MAGSRARLTELVPVTSLHLYFVIIIQCFFVENVSFPIAKRENHLFPSNLKVSGDGRNETEILRFKGFFQ